MGRDDFTKIPNGIPSLEERINLLYTHGVKAGRIDLHTLVNVASTQVAKTLRPLPAQGHDPARRRRRPGRVRPGLPGRHFRAKTQHMNVDYSAFEGWKIEGRPSVVTVRGEVAVRDGKFVGDPSRGRFLHRTPSRMHS